MHCDPRRGEQGAEGRVQSWQGFKPLNGRSDQPLYFQHRQPAQVPLVGTEGVFTASVLGCTYYVLVAWIWSIIWHMGLDPLKVTRGCL